MTLRQQVRQIAAKHVGEKFAEYYGDRIDTLLNTLARKAFVEQWNKGDADILRYACKMMDEKQMITEDEPAYHPIYCDICGDLTTPPLHRIGASDNYACDICRKWLPLPADK